jgi:threonyl-tRNA synthetase
MSQKLSILRRFAAHLLAAAVQESFPNVHLLGGGATAWGFYYDFIFDVPFQKEFLRILEEKIVQFQDAGDLFETLEMIPKNAAEYLRHLKQPILAKKVLSLSQEPTVTLLRVRQTADLCPLPHLKSARDIPFVKLFDFHQSKERLRLFGLAAWDRDSLSQAVKQRPRLPRQDHQILGEESHLFSPFSQGWLWAPRGEALRESLLHFFKAQLVTKNYAFLSVTPQISPASEASNLSWITSYFSNHHHQTKISTCSWESHTQASYKEGLLDANYFFRDYSVCFCDQTDVISSFISSLQSILKILNILRFELQLVLYPAGSNKIPESLTQAIEQVGINYREGSRYCKHLRLEVVSYDGVGREWLVSFLEMRNPHKNASCNKSLLVHSFFVSLERVIALLLEKYEGTFPFWLAPEHIRLLVIGEENQFVRQLKQDLSERQFRFSVYDTSRDNLNELVREGCKEKVPFIGVIGPRELESERVIVRACDSKEKREMTRETLIETLHKEERH